MESAVAQALLAAGGTDAAAAEARNCLQQWESSPGYYSALMVRTQRELHRERVTQSYRESYTQSYTQRER
jgi:hypothetical protein